MTGWSRPVWRWLSSSVLFAMAVPLLLMAIILSAMDLGWDAIWANGDLFLFALGLFASGRAALTSAAKKLSAEVLGDVMLALMLLSSGCWVTIVTLQKAGHTVEAWLPGWVGAGVLLLSVILATLCVAIGIAADASQSGREAG